MPKRGRAEVERLVGLVGTVDPDTATVAGVVHHALRHDIISLKLPPGSPLRIHELRRRYEAGATPLREALCTLVGEGLVESEPQHGFRVMPTTREDLRSLAILRREIEPQALRLSMQAGDAAWMREVTEAYLAFQAVGTKVGDERPIERNWELRHRAFHMSTLSACGLVPMLQLVARCYDLGDRYRRLASPNLGATAGTHADHEGLYLAVRAGDVEGAVSLLRRHVQDNTDRHLAYFDMLAEA
jgi:GntR family transcriptional regulator, carbon starvation induced regulator